MNITKFEKKNSVELSNLNKSIINELIQLLKEFLKNKEKDNAKKIEVFTIKIIDKHEDKLNPWLEEILFGFLDFNHYSNERNPPTYKLKDVRRIYKKLLEIKENKE